MLGTFLNEGILFQRVLFFRGSQSLNNLPEAMYCILAILKLYLIIDLLCNALGITSTHEQNDFLNSK